MFKGILLVVTVIATLLVAIVKTQGLEWVSTPFGVAIGTPWPNQTALVQMYSSGTTALEFGLSAGPQNLPLVKACADLPCDRTALLMAILRDGQLQLRPRTISLDELGPGCHSTGRQELVRQYWWDPGGTSGETTQVSVLSSYAGQSTSGNGGAAVLNVDFRMIRVCVTELRNGKNFVDRLTLEYLPLAGTW